MSPEVLVMSQKAWQSLSAEDQKIFREAALQSSQLHAREMARSRGALAPAGGSRRRRRSSRISTASRSRRRWPAIYDKAQRDPASAQLIERIRKVE